MNELAAPMLKHFKVEPIILMKPIRGVKTSMNGNFYPASNQAVRAFSKAICMEFLPHGLRASQIKPGLADSIFSVVRYKGDEEKAKQVYEGFNALRSQDIARAALFILESPSHVCINDLEITPTAQANAFLIEKNS